MSKKDLHYSIVVRIYGEDKCFGPGIAELLERVSRTKSLRKATLEMDMAYSKAWRILRAAEENLGFPLLVSSIGGRGGGGADLTPEGARFLASYRRFEKAVGDFAAKTFPEMMDLSGDRPRND